MGQPVIAGGNIIRRPQENLEGLLGGVGEIIGAIRKQRGDKAVTSELKDMLSGLDQPSNLGTVSASGVPAGIMVPAPSPSREGVFDTASKIDTSPPQPLQGEDRLRAILNASLDPRASKKLSDRLQAAAVITERALPNIYTNRKPDRRNYTVTNSEGKRQKVSATDEEAEQIEANLPTGSTIELGVLDKDATAGKPDRRNYTITNSEGKRQKVSATVAEAEQIKANLPSESTIELGVLDKDTTATSPYGKIDVSKWTRESLNKFDKTRNFTDLVPIETEEEVDLRGLGATREKVFTPIRTGADKGKFKLQFIDEADGKVKDFLGTDGETITLTNTERLAFLGKKARSVTDPFQAELDKAAGKIAGERLEGFQNEIIAANESDKTIARGRELLARGIFAGPLANIKTTFNKFLKETGINLTGNTVADTETFAINMAQDVLSLLKTRVLGSGTAVSDEDRKFALRLAAADVTLDENSIRQLLDINERINQDRRNRANNEIGIIKRQREMSDPFAVPVPITTDRSHSGGISAEEAKEYLMNRMNR